MGRVDFDPKIQGLLSLQAMLIDYAGNYQSHEYLYYVMSQLEKVKKASVPWHLMDPQQYQTFQSLVVEHLGGDRRSGSDRRQGTGAALADDRPDSRKEDRRWG